MIFILKYIVPKGFVGITLYPFIFLKEKHLKNDKIIVNHEKIHLRQQIELFVVFFYVFYFIEWFYKLIKYRNKNIAYRNLSFEREAYEHENDLEYLRTRKRGAFLKYL